MSTTKFLSMAVLLTVTAFRLPAAESAIEREAQDRKQIEKLMWQYARALDSENPEAYAAVYTPDGQFGAGPTPVKGRDALKKVIQDLRDRARRTKRRPAKSGLRCSTPRRTATSNSPTRTMRTWRRIG